MREQYGCVLNGRGTKSLKGQILHEWQAAPLISVQQGTLYFQATISGSNLLLQKSFYESLYVWMSSAPRLSNEVIAYIDANTVFTRVTVMSQI